MRISNIVRVSVFSGLLLGCGVSKGPDAKDEPTFTDKMREVITGKSRWKELSQYNEEFTGSFNDSDGQSHPFSLRIYTLPYAAHDSKKHSNLNMDLVAEMQVGEETFALTGEGSHLNLMRNDGAHNSLKSREFIELRFATVYGADYVRGSGQMPKPEYLASMKAFREKISGKSIDDQGLDSWSFLAERVNGKLSDGKIRALICPKNGSCQHKDLSEWEALFVRASQPDVIDERTINSENFSFASKVEHQGGGKISWMEVRSLKQ